jgi:biotin transport system substrate-specific component
MTSRSLTARTGVSANGVALRLGLAGAFALAAAAAAQVRIPLPFTPVPITAQTAVVLISGAALGAGWGGLAMGFYLVAGTLGAPFFAGGEAGPLVLLGPTGGYLLAFLLVPPLVGRAVGPGTGAARAFLVMLAASGVILLWGMLQLALVMDLTLPRAFALGVAPFLAGDILKAAAAAAAFRAARPWIARLRD